MEELTNRSVFQLLQYLYPDLYRIDDLTDANSIEATDKDASDTESEEEGSPGRPVLIPQPSR